MNIDTTDINIGLVTLHKGDTSPEGKTLASLLSFFLMQSPKKKNLINYAFPAETDTLLNNELTLDAIVSTQPEAFFLEDPAGSGQLSIPFYALTPWIFISTPQKVATATIPLPTSAWRSFTYSTESAPEFNSLLTEAKKKKEELRELFLKVLRNEKSQDTPRNAPEIATAQRTISTAPATMDTSSPEFLQQLFELVASANLTHSHNVFDEFVDFVREKAAQNTTVPKKEESTTLVSPLSSPELGKESINISDTRRIMGNDPAAHFARAFGTIKLYTTTLNQGIYALAKREITTLLQLGSLEKLGVVYKNTPNSIRVFPLLEPGKQTGVGTNTSYPDLPFLKIFRGNDKGYTPKQLTNLLHKFGLKHARKEILVGKILPVYHPVHFEKTEDPFENDPEKQQASSVVCTNGIIGSNLDDVLSAINEELAVTHEKKDKRILLGLGRTILAAYYQTISDWEKACNNKKIDIDSIYSEENIKPKNTPAHVTLDYQEKHEQFKELILSYFSKSPALTPLSQIWDFCGKIITEENLELTPANIMPGIDVHFANFGLQLPLIPKNSVELLEELCKKYLKTNNSQRAKKDTKEGGKFSRYESTSPDIKVICDNIIPLDPRLFYRQAWAEYVRAFAADIRYKNIVPQEEKGGREKYPALFKVQQRRIVRLVRQNELFKKRRGNSALTTHYLTSILANLRMAYLCHSQRKTLSGRTASDNTEAKKYDDEEKRLGKYFLDHLKKVSEYGRCLARELLKNDPEKDPVLEKYAEETITHPQESQAGVRLVEQWGKTTQNTRLVLNQPAPETNSPQPLAKKQKQAIACYFSIIAEQVRQAYIKKTGTP